jgi:hypothetical protein
LNRPVAFAIAAFALVGFGSVRRAAAQPARPPDAPPEIAASFPCSACARPVGDRAWRVRGRPGVFCDECRATATPCAVCGAPTRTARIRDARWFCPECTRTLIEDAAEIDVAYRGLLRTATERLGLTLSEPPALLVESATGIRAQAGVQEPPVGLCGLYVRDGEAPPSIHVIAPLPRARLCAVLAHEIAHAWQAERCPEEQGARVREGFAEWVSWKLLEGIEGGDGERHAIESRTDVYGDGFRLFAALDARGGADHAIWYAQVAVKRPRRGPSPAPVRGRATGPRRPRCPRRSAPTPA